MRPRLVCLAIAMSLVVSMAPAGAGEPSVPAESNVAPDSPTAKPRQTLRVAAVQMRSASNLAENVIKIRQHLKSSAADGARVVVFPECALSGYLDSDYIQGLTREQLADAELQVADACRENNIYAVVGTPHRDGDKLYNSAVVIGPAGQVLERYHKIQLAEAWPAGGDHLAVFKIDGVPCSIIICHDERYPELVRLPVLAGARLIFYVSHESGIKQEHKIAPYRAQIQARAVENTVYVVQANAPANEDTSGSHGQSRVIGPDGNIVEEASVFGEDVVRATLDLSRATGSMARQSVDRGPLGEWWREGIKQVRIVGE